MFHIDTNVDLTPRRPIGRLGRGFTLIELLVVIAIIGIVSMIGVASFQSAARSGRDGKRKGDLSQVRAALELYRSQQNAYPASANYPNMITTLKNAGYISDPTPQDPKSGYAYTYSVPVAGQYCLCGHLESTGTGNSTDTSCTNTTGDYFCVTQP